MPTITKVCAVFDGSKEITQTLNQQWSVFKVQREGERHTHVCVLLYDVHARTYIHAHTHVFVEYIHTHKLCVCVYVYMIKAL